jgi:hypothetical protein
MASQIQTSSEEMSENMFKQIDRLKTLSRRVLTLEISADFHQICGAAPILELHPGS